MCWISRGANGQPGSRERERESSGKRATSDVRGAAQNDRELLASYNPFSDETTFRIEFLPRLGGLNQPRRDRFGGVDPRAQSVFDY
jgi:hypothetical protein